MLEHLKKYRDPIKASAWVKTLARTAHVSFAALCREAGTSEMTERRWRRKDVRPSDQMLIRFYEAAKRLKDK